MDDDRRREPAVNAAVATSAVASPPPEWLDALYREHSRDVIRTAYRVTGNPDDAEDVLHTVFLRLAKRADRPQLGPRAGAYLRRAATNAALDLVTSGRARTTGQLDDTHLRLVEDRMPDPEQQRHGGDLARALRRCLCDLNRRGAEMFILRYLEGLDNHAIAELFETTAGSVAVTLHRVRARLREQLAPLLGGPR